MSNPIPRPPLFTGKELGIVAACIVAFIILGIAAGAGGFWTLVTLGPILAIALILGTITLTVWLFYKFGVIVVRHGVIAAHEELARRAPLHPLDGSPQEPLA